MKMRVENPLLNMSTSVFIFPCLTARYMPFIQTHSVPFNSSDFNSIVLSFSLHPLTCSRLSPPSRIRSSASRSSTRCLRSHLRPGTRAVTRQPSANRCLLCVLIPPRELVSQSRVRIPNMRIELRHWMNQNLSRSQWIG